MTGTSIVEAAPAKLNLYLHVTGRRADGYHELDSLVAFAEFGDSIALTPAATRVALRGADLPPAGPRLAIAGPFGPALMGENPANNLVIRAAHALAARLGHEADVMIALTKALPVASGIGGGSADAAACLPGEARDSRSASCVAAVDHVLRAGDESGLVGQKEQDDVGHLFGLTKAAHRMQAHQCLVCVPGQVLQQRLTEQTG